MRGRKEEEGREKREEEEEDLEKAAEERKGKTEQVGEKVLGMGVGWAWGSGDTFLRGELIWSCLASVLISSLLILLVTFNSVQRKHTNSVRRKLEGKVSQSNLSLLLGGKRAPIAFPPCPARSGSLGRVPVDQ